MLDRAMRLAEPMLAAPDAAAASAVLLNGLEREGAVYLQTRLYRRPLGALTNETHFAAGGLVSRLAPPGWAESGAFHYVCFTHNPLLAAIRRSLTRYRFSDFAPRNARENGAYWEAFGEARIAEALCATAYGSGRRIASLHLGFDRTEFDPAEAFAIQMAGAMLVERLMATAPDAPEPAEEEIRLTARERDSLAFVAQGKTDWEIGTIFGVSQATARFHIDNARKKLGAVNRAQAVARYLALEGGF